MHNKLLELKMPSDMGQIIFLQIYYLISAPLKIHILRSLMHLVETFPLQEIKKDLFFKISYFHPHNLVLITHCCNSDFWKHLQKLEEFMGVKIYITKRRLEHPAFSIGLMTKHWNSDICDSAAKIFIPLSISHFFLSFFFPF